MKLDDFLAPIFLAVETVAGMLGVTRPENQPVPVRVRDHRDHPAHRR